MITTLVYRDSKLAAQNPPVESIGALRDEPGVMLWVDLSAPTDEEIKQILETAFRFHPLAIEDCVSDAPLPKIEPYDDWIHIVMHAVDYTQAQSFMTTELDLFLGKNFLVTFHRQPLRVIDAARERLLKAPSSIIRGPDRFAHSILDLMVDAYKPALDSLRHQVDGLADSVLNRVSAEELFPRIVAVRKQLAQLRQIVRPQRAVAADLAQGKTKLIRSIVLPYLRDLEEELGRIETQASTWSDQLIVSFRIFLNKSSHEANEGIRVMTAIAALTFPALVIGSWYGMNFTGFMPEISAAHGYTAAAAITLLATVGILFYMRRKKWL